MGNSGCNMCPGSRGLSYIPIESDNETMGAWAQDRLSRTEHSARLRIKEEVLDELLAILAEDKEIQENYGHYSPPELSTLERNNVDTITTRRHAHGIPGTDVHGVSGGAEHTFDSELLERHATVSSMDYRGQHSANGSEFSGSNCTIVDHDDDRPTGENKDGTTEFFDNLLGHVGLNECDINESEIFQHASSKQRGRSCLTIAELRTRRNRMLKDEYPREENL